MQAGTSGTVAFNVEHGCDGSPTTSMKFQIPDGVTDAVGVAKDGWTATLTGSTLEFAGGPLAADQEDHFDITFTAPATPGNISFPVIQTCEQGETDWIEPIVEGAEEPEHPAPTIKITADAPTAEELTPAPEEEEGTEGTVVATSDTVVARRCHVSRSTRRRFEQHRSDRCGRGDSSSSCWSAVALPCRVATSRHHRARRLAPDPE